LDCNKQQEQADMNNLRRLLNAGLFVCAAVLATPSGADVTPGAARLDAALRASLRAPQLQAGQSATLLPSGDWLVLGGRGKDGRVMASAQLFNARSGKTLGLAAHLNIARAGQSANVLPDGTVLIIGGEDDAGMPLAIVERYRPDTRAFENVGDLGLLARTQHSATLLMDGRLLIAGGVGSKKGQALDQAELLNTDTLRVEPFSTRLQAARFAHLAALLPSDHVLISGGQGRLQDGILGPELFDRMAGRFLPATDAILLAALSAIDGGPGLRESLPAAESATVGVDARIVLRFSKPLDVTRITKETITVVGPNGAIAADVVPAEHGVLAFVTPKQQLLPASSYTVFIQGVADEDGREVPFTTFGFRTRALGDSSAVSSFVATPGTSQGVAVPVAVKPADAKSNNAADDDDADEEWIPSRHHYKGEWRSDRASRAKKHPPHLIETRRAFLAEELRRDGRVREDQIDRMLPTGASVPQGVTGFAGQILRLNGKPLAGVTVRIGKLATVSDANGEFLLTDVPPGDPVVQIDGSSANTARRHYGRYFHQVHIEAGKVNALPQPVWMVKLDTKHAIKLASPTTKEVVLTNPKLPGVEVRLPPGTVIRDADGKIVTEVSLTPVPADQTPFAMPYGEIPVYYTLQPGGAMIQSLSGKLQGVKIIYPNYSTQPPGARFQLFDYDPNGRGWYIYGTATVSPDGKRIVGDKEFVLYQFSASSAASSGGTAPDKGPKNCDDDSCKCPKGGTAGDPVSCQDGLFTETATDVALQDVAPLTLTRSYRNEDPTQRSFGVGASHRYDAYLYFPNMAGYNATEIDMVLGNGARIPFYTTGVTQYNTGVIYQSLVPGRFYRAKLQMTGDSLGYGFSVTLADGTVYRFSYYSSRLRWIQDRWGNRIALTRDLSSRITRISGATQYIDLQYGVPNCTNCISKATDLAGRHVDYTYDTAGRLIKVTDQESGVTQYSYDAATNRMLTVTDARNNVKVTNQYYTSADGPNLDGRVKQQTYADGSTNGFAYTFDDGNILTKTEVTRERGDIRRIEYNGDGLIVKETLAVGTPEQQIVTNVWHPVTKLLTSSTDALGRITEYQYDGMGNTTQVTRMKGTASEASWTYTYEPNFNQVATVTDPQNHTTTFTYDALGNLLQIKDPLNHKVDLTYNAAGQLLTVTRYAGGKSLTTTYSYDAGALSAITDPLGRTTQVFVDAVGRIQGTTDPLGNVTQTAYDNLDRVVQVTSPAGQGVQLAYDPVGNLKTFSDAKGNATQFTYDSRNRLLTRKDPLNATESYAYDAAGNLTRITDRKGQVSGFTYDYLNRRTGAGFGATSGAPTNYQSTVAYTWDAGDRMTQAVDSVSGTIARSYDGFDRLTQETTPQGQLDYTYSTAGLRATMTVAGQAAVGYTWDAANRLTQIAQSGATVSFAYDEANRRTSLTLANGVVVSYSYDDAGQLTGLTYQKGGTAQGDLTYTYDAGGRRIATGGSLAQTDLPATVQTTAYDAANRLTNWNGATVATDANGSLTGDGTRSYQWDERNRLVQITEGATPIATFNYDAFNRRIGKSINGSSTGFLHDGWQIVQELNGATPKANLLTGLNLDEVFRRTENGTTSDYLADALGSVRGLMDGAGALQATYTYEPYGATTAMGSLSSNALQYTGRENDGTGLYYYRNRYYSPGWGRFISEDPMGFAAGQNLYQYVSGNPAGFTDPLGEDWRTWVQAIGIAIGLAGSPGIGPDKPNDPLQVPQQTPSEPGKAPGKRLPDPEKSTAPTPKLPRPAAPIPAPPASPAICVPKVPWYVRPPIPFILCPACRSLMPSPSEYGGPSEA
jgi:RHS repeat-associated protein